MPRYEPVGSAFSKFPDIPQSKSLHSTHDYSDSFIPHISNHISSEEKDIEEPEIELSNRFTETILEADTHYNSNSVDQSPKLMILTIYSSKH